MGSAVSNRRRGVSSVGPSGPSGVSTTMTGQRICIDQAVGGVAPATTQTTRGVPSSKSSTSHFTAGRGLAKRFRGARKHGSTGALYGGGESYTERNPQLRRQFDEWAGGGDMLESDGVMKILQREISSLQARNVELAEEVMWLREHFNQQRELRVKDHRSEEDQVPGAYQCSHDSSPQPTRPLQAPLSRLPAAATDATRVGDKRDLEGVINNSTTANDESGSVAVRKIYEDTANEKVRPKGEPGQAVPQLTRRDDGVEQNVNFYEGLITKLQEELRFQNHEWSERLAAEEVLAQRFESAVREEMGEIGFQRMCRKAVSEVMNEVGASSGSSGDCGASLPRGGGFPPRPRRRFIGRRRSAATQNYDQSSSSPLTSTDGGRRGVVGGARCYYYSSLESSPPPAYFYSATSLNNPNNRAPSEATLVMGEAEGGVGAQERVGMRLFTSNCSLPRLEQRGWKHRKNHLHGSGNTNDNVNRLSLPQLCPDLLSVDQRKNDSVLQHGGSNRGVLLSAYRRTKTTTIKKSSTLTMNGEPRLRPRTSLPNGFSERSNEEKGVGVATANEKVIQTMGEDGNYSEAANPTPPLDPPLIPTDQENNPCEGGHEQGGGATKKRIVPAMGSQSPKFVRSKILTSLPLAKELFDTPSVVLPSECPTKNGGVENDVMLDCSKQAEQKIGYSLEDKGEALSRNIQEACINTNCTH